MTNFTRLIENTTLGEDDEKVLKALQTTRKKGIAGVSDWTAGIRNERGVVYRVVQLEGLNQAMGFSNRMDKLGFIDEMPDDGSNIEGYDTTFRKE